VVAVRAGAAEVDRSWGRHAHLLEEAIAAGGEGTGRCGGPTARHPIKEMEITHFSDGLGVEVVGVGWGRAPSHGAACGACSTKPLVVVAPMTRSGMKGR
jgi:hypothetical protein